MIYIKNKKQNNNVHFSSNELNALNCFSSIEEVYSFLNKVANFSCKGRSVKDLLDIRLLPQKERDQVLNEDLKMMAKIQEQLGHEATAREMANAAMERDAMIANGQSPENFWKFKGPQKAK